MQLMPLLAVRPQCWHSTGSGGEASGRDATGAADDRSAGWLSMIGGSRLWSWRHPPWRTATHRCRSALGLRRAFDASCVRLGGQLERIQLHWSTARYAPWQEGPLLDGLADLVSEGAVASLGLSNFGPRRLRQVHGQLRSRGIRLASLQVQCSLLAPSPIEPGGVAAVCRDLEIQLIAYSPLALGLLARPPAASVPATTGARRLLFARLWPRIQPLLELLADIARARQVPQAAVALNWCRSHGAMPIVGLRTVEQARLAAAASRWSLDGAERLALDAAARTLSVGMPSNPFDSD